MRFGRFKRNRVRKRIKADPKYIFGSLVVLCLALLFCSYKFADRIAPFKAIAGNFITPIQRGIDHGADSISTVFKRFRDVEELLSENDKLKSDIQALRDENQSLLRDKYEVDRYRELYDLDSKYSDYDKIAAKVISREPNNYCNVFIIDRGYADGIAKDMNVLAGNGLVGIVTEVGRNWAKVRSIIDDTSSVSGMFLKTSDTCVVSGDMELIDEGYIRVGMISNNAEIYEHYEVVTSYISNKYLPGLLIGYVTDIHPDPSLLSQEAYLIPVVDFEHIEAVLVIRQLREQYDDLKEVMSSDN